MNVETKHTLRFSRREVIEALKAAHPGSIHLTALPATPPRREADKPFGPAPVDPVSWAIEGNSLTITFKPHG